MIFTFVDRNIFDRSVNLSEVKIKKPTFLYYFYRSSNSLGVLEGTFSGYIYEKYANDRFIPVEVFIDEHWLCGWIKKDSLVI